MGAEWAMKVSAVTTWYPGNPDEATQQVLGPQELPSRWNGDWRRTMIGTSPGGYIAEGGTALQLLAPRPRGHLAASRVDCTRGAAPSCDVESARSRGLSDSRTGARATGRAEVDVREDRARRAHDGAEVQVHPASGYRVGNPVRLDESRGNGCAHNGDARENRCF